MDAQLSFSTARHNALPVGSTQSWAGTLTAPEAGTYWINFGELGITGSVTIDGTTVIRSDSFVGTPNPRFGTVKATATPESCRPPTGSTTSECSSH